MEIQDEVDKCNIDFKLNASLFLGANGKSVCELGELLLQ